MPGFNFWRWWLIVISLWFALVGIVVAVAGDSALFALWNRSAARLFWGAEAIPEDASAFKAFLFGPLGGTMLGLYVFQAFIAYYPFARRERWAWNAIALSLLAWFCLDSAVSLYHGALFNVVQINLLTLAATAPPLIFTFREFYPRRV